MINNNINNNTFMRFAKKFHTDTRCPCTSGCSLISKRATAHANVVINGFLVMFFNSVAYTIICSGYK